MFKTISISSYIPEGDRVGEGDFDFDVVHREGPAIPLFFPPYVNNRAPRIGYEVLLLVSFYGSLMRARVLSAKLSFSYLIIGLNHFESRLPIKVDLPELGSPRTQTCKRLAL